MRLTPGEHEQWTAWNEYTQRRTDEIGMEDEYAPIPATKPRPLFMQAEYVWTVQPNEDGEDVAIRYRIEGLGR